MPLFGCADHPAGGAVDHDLRRRVAVDAHLVFQAAAVDGVARAERAVLVHQELRHDEQADALDAGRRVRQARQHQVDDVAGHVVLAGADEDLVAGDPVAAVGLRFGLGAHQAQVGAAMRFGQAHGAGPLAAGHLRQVGLLLLVGAVREQGRVGAVREARVHGPRLVGAVEHLVEALVHHQRQALAAVFRIARQRGPAALDVLGIGLLEALGRGDLVRFLVQLAAFLVAAHVERERDFGRELAGFLEHRIDGVGVGFGVLRQGLELLGDLEHFVHDELHVAQRRGIGGHLSVTPWGFWWVSGVWGTGGPAARLARRTA